MPATTLDKDLIAQFAAITGEKNAFVSAEDIAPYLIEQRDLYHGKTALVLRPANVQEVSEIMKLAYATATPIVPQGGNTGLVGGQQPDQSGNAIIISLNRMNKIRSIDTFANLITVEAGVILKNLQQAAEAEGRLFPLSLGAEGSCQVGGNLSTNAGGTAVLAYGNMRELCLGLEVVLPNGEILNDLRYVKKDNSGYNLKDLFIGAEGTLGIITAAVLKLSPQPKGRTASYVGLKTPADAIRLFQLARDTAAGELTGFELMPRIGVEFTIKHIDGVRDPLEHPHEWYVLIEISSNRSQEDARETLETILTQAFEADILQDAAIAESVAQMEAFWKMREEMSWAQKPEGGSIKHDISVPIPSIPDFIEEAGRAVDEMIPQARVVCFGHIGDGNLHYNVSQPLGADKQEFLSLWTELNHRIHLIVNRYNGSVAAEHGVGQLKRECLNEFKDETALSLMHKLKLVIDDKNIMNPGKVL